jgi:regulatory protein
MPKKLLKSLEEGEEYALRLLGIRDYSHDEIRQKLRGKGLGVNEAEEILKKLEARGLIDDRRYARRLAAFYTRDKLWGPQRVVHRLLQKRISLDLAREATGQAEEDGASRERLQKVLRLKLKGQGLDKMLPQEKRRLTNYLRQRGFLWEDIMEALQEAGGFTEE